jgi:hypothetical protein
MFKLIAWIIFFYLLFKVFRNFLSPFLNAGRQTQTPYNQQQDGYNRPKEGSTTIHKTNSSGKRNDADDDGEYIDYKEIKE